jgi:uncharacterized membrane protein YbjE (DUF340 family)
MVLFSVILFLAAIPTGWVSLAIYRGKTDLIHDYHQTKVTDKAAYGKDFGKAMFVVTAALFLGGIVGLLGSSEAVASAAVAVLLIGLTVGILCIIAVQAKHNRSKKDL